MRSRQATLALVVSLLAVYGVELATNSAGNELALLRLGALPNSGQLNGQYWRLVTSSFLHLNPAHLLLNCALLWWIGGIVERRLGVAQAAAIYATSVLGSAAVVMLVRAAAPKAGSTLGASGGAFGLLGAALVLVYRRDAKAFGQDSGLRLGLWICLLIGVAISFVPGVSLAGHAGGLVCGPVLAALARVKPAAGGLDPERAR